MNDENLSTALTTARLRLVPATRAMISAELDGPDRLAALFDAELPAD